MPGLKSQNRTCLCVKLNLGGMNTQAYPLSAAALDGLVLPPKAALHNDILPAALHFSMDAAAAAAAAHRCEAHSDVGAICIHRPLYEEHLIGAQQDVAGLAKLFKRWQECWRINITYK